MLFGRTLTSRAAAPFHLAVTLFCSDPRWGEGHTWLCHLEECEMSTLPFGASVFFSGQISDPQTLPYLGRGAGADTRPGRTAGQPTSSSIFLALGRMVSKVCVEADPGCSETSTEPCTFILT